jgi:hypothetical protein
MGYPLLVFREFIPVSPEIAIFVQEIHQPTEIDMELTKVFELMTDNSEIGYQPFMELVRCALDDYVEKMRAKLYGYFENTVTFERFVTDNTKGCDACVARSRFHRPEGTAYYLSVFVFPRYRMRPQMSVTVSNCDPMAVDIDSDLASLPTVYRHMDDVGVISLPDIMLTAVLRTLLGVHHVQVPEVPGDSRETPADAETPLDIDDTQFSPFWRGPADKRFLIVQTDEHDMYFECRNGMAAETLMKLLDGLMRLHCNGKTPGSLRGMHMAADPEGAKPMWPSISNELFGMTILAKQG